MCVLNQCKTKEFLILVHFNYFEFFLDNKLTYRRDIEIPFHNRNQSLFVVPQKKENLRIAQLKIKEERNLGSLTCHILKESEKPFSFLFSANASTRFPNARTYDPYG